MITIVPITDHEVYEVNGKEIQKDSNGKWIAREEFTQQERNAFTNYKKAVISNPNFKRHTKATYKVQSGGFPEWHTVKVRVFAGSKFKINQYEKKSQIIRVFRVNTGYTFKAC